MLAPKIRRILIHYPIGWCMVLSCSVAHGNHDAVPADLDEEIIVSATRIPTPLDEVGSSVTIISGSVLRDRQLRFVDDVLRSVSGVDSTQNGGRGTLANVRIRGQGTEASFVLIDGMEVSDPGATQTRFNFANLTGNGIERIEVLRGSQTVLYGGDAVGGVINISTRAGGDNSGALYTEAGSYDTRLAGADFSGSTDNGLVRFGGSAQHYDTGGFSAADSRLPGNSEHDGYDNTSINGRADATITDNFSLKSALRYHSGTASYDAFGGAFGDDSDRGEDYRQISAKVAGQFDGGNVSADVSYAVSSDVREGFDNGADSNNNRGQREKWAAHGNWRLADSNTLAFGVERERESLVTKDLPNGNRLRANVHINGYYLLQQLALSEQWHLSLGARLDDHETFGSFDTYRIATAYQRGNSLIKASAATGFRAPSLFELYGVCCGEPIGNDTLQPERSRSFDLGIQQQWLGRRLELEATLFYIETDNEIVFDGATFGNGDLPNYFNIGADTKSRGVEISHRFSANGYVQWLVNYTYNRVEDEYGAPLSQRPKHAFFADLAFQVAPPFNGHLSVRHYRDTLDTDFSAFPAQTVKLDEPWLLDVAVNYEVTEHLRATARVENALDERYQAVFGYGAAGRAAYAGLYYTF